jgi:hypothetical protein
MKRKGPYVPGSFVMKWHAIAFAVFTVALWMSVLATFEYPANVDLDFAVFKPFLVERMQINIVWGMLLLAHFTLHQFQLMLHLREQVAQLTALAPVQELLAGRRLHDILPADQAPLFYDDDVQSISRED